MPSAIRVSKKAAGRPADSGALKVTVGEKISALRLGVENGATAQTVYTVTGNDTKSMKKARALAAEHGMKVVFFAGGNLGVHTRADKHGYVASARGLVQGDTVYVRVDHEQFTADQLMRHEMGHKSIENGAVDTEVVRERIRKEFGPEQFNTIVQLYLEAYAETGMTADEIWEEIVCDSLGDMNIFSDTFEGLQRKTGELLRSTKKAANETRGEKREQEGRAPPEGQKRSIDVSNPYLGKSLSNDSDVYDYDFLVSLPAMVVDDIPSLSEVKTGNRVDRSKAIESGMKNARSIGTLNKNGTVTVQNAYTGRGITISRTSLGHGLGGENIARLRTNARLTSIAGNVVRNAVPLNALKTENKQATGTYVMGCLLNSGNRQVVAVVTVEQKTNDVISIELSDNMHSVNGRIKKEEAGGLPQGNPDVSPATPTSSITIADFLDVVNSTHRSLLSDDVLNHYNEERPSNGYYSDRVMFSQDLESFADLRRENRELRERAKKWRRETLRSKGRETVRAEDVKKAAKVLIEDMQSTIRPSEITGDLTALAEYMMRGEGKNDRTPVWAEIKERAGVIAEKLVDNAEAMREGGDPENYRELKQYLRDTKLTIDDADKGDMH